jgi:hypothetical protein
MTTLASSSHHGDVAQEIILLHHFFALVAACWCGINHPMDRRTKVSSDEQKLKSTLLRSSPPASWGFLKGPLRAEEKCRVVCAGPNFHAAVPHEEEELELRKPLRRRNHRHIRPDDVGPQQQQLHYDGFA